MKKALLFVLSLILVLSIAACGDPENPGTPDSEPTEAVTDAPTGDPTEEPTEKPTAEPTASPKPALADEMKNLPFPADAPGVKTLFFDDFSSGDWSSDDESVSQFGTVDVCDGALCFPFQDGAFLENQIETYAPPAELDFDRYEQIQVSFDLKTDHCGSVSDYGYVACMVGLFTPTVDLTSIPTTNGHGIWMAFNDTQSVLIYGASSAKDGGWPEGCASMKLGESFHGEFKHLDIVVNKGDTISVYMTGSSGERVLAFTLVIAPEQLELYDAAGKLKRKVKNEADTIDGCGLEFFAHINYTTIDNLGVYAY